MKTLYTDASFDWTSTEKVIENVVRGKIAISDGEKFNYVDKVAIGKVPELKQYINILELFAIGRAIELAIEHNFKGILSIWSDSQVAVGWANNKKINPKVETEAHRNALEYVIATHKKYGEVEYNFIPRDQNPAGKLLEAELEKESPHTKCSRCNDNGCPTCDGTKGSKYNPEPY
ncbi:MAG: hypothetical protein UW07_C0019G0011 [Candidatus Nomurabacteria bacterium GW2011_GWF2_43_8]|uniref:Uncharacterized protein n=3 Tax=Parcubacteria group TaxID=1794811 RepID=A0A0G1HWB7_9BACT|nr:MAG: hypothetical protein UW02_C0002G0031 [Candidatus Nomurabacteria bacterium GW2011_GWB1_43_7]KKT23932.1 MAG: hypothetical protein UW07_C0019G0011 [Candidatus Nomurabacteria bacterium GW2011_GWF2_43_8]KKU05047.1 MAG: hypothetical protein UX06_C0004G0015 [Candidatus Giovannonibacteria bacterium GW2011_GWA2_45_21]